MQPLILTFKDYRGKPVETSIDNNKIVSELIKILNISANRVSINEIFGTNVTVTILTTMSKD